MSWLTLRSTEALNLILVKFQKNLTRLSYVIQLVQASLQLSV